MGCVLVETLISDDVRPAVRAVLDKALLVREGGG